MAATPRTFPSVSTWAETINRYALPVELMIGGFARGGGFVMTSVGKSMPEIGWLNCIGSGGDAAFGRLMQRSQHPHMSLPRCLVHIAEAMKDAHLAEPKTVGDYPSDYVIITREGIQRLPSKDPTLQELISQYAERDTEDLDSNNAVLEQIKAALYIPGITKEDYAQGIRSPQEKSRLSASQTITGQQ